MDKKKLFFGGLVLLALLALGIGVKQLSSIHGSILTAWGIAGVAGPLILAFMKENTGGYAATGRWRLVATEMASPLPFS